MLYWYWAITVVYTVIYDITSNKYYAVQGDHSN